MKKKASTANKLRNNMDAAEYKHVVLGLIFLKYISDAFDEHYRTLVGLAHRTGHSPLDHLAPAFLQPAALDIQCDLAGLALSNA